MKKLLTGSKPLAFCLILTSLILSSFIRTPGGEGVEVYLNNHLILQSFNTDLKTVKVLPLETASLTDELTIKYHHCGEAGKNRKFQLKNDNNVVVKEWQFKDERNVPAIMTCKVKELGNLSGTLKLYYFSTQVPEGRTLAAIKGAGIVAKR